MIRKLWLLPILLLATFSLKAQCDLNISFQVGNCVPGSSTRPVTFTITNPDDNANEIDIYIDGVLTWSEIDIDDDMPVVFTHWFPPGTTHTIYVESVDDPSCNETLTFTLPTCPCSMTITASVVPNSCSGGQVEVNVTVTVNNPVGDGFNLFLDGQSVGNFNYSGASSTTVTINAPGNGGSHTINVQDDQQSSCQATTSITTPNCVCTMSVAAAVAGPCSGGQVPVNVTVTVTNPVGNGFNLFLDGQLLAGSPFQYSGGSSTTVTINVNGNGGSHTILAQDEDQSSCQATTSVSVPNCACSMTVAAAVAGPCSGGQVPVNVTVTVVNPVGDGFNLFLDGQLVAGSPFQYSGGSSTTVTINVVGNNASHTILARDEDQTNCSATTNITTPNCACSMSISAAVGGSCSGGQVPVNVTVTVVNPVGSGFNLFLDGQLVAGSPFPYSGGSSTTVTINVIGNNASHTIAAQDAAQSSCQATTNITTPNCACSMSVSAAVSGSCAGGNVPVTVTVTVQNPQGSGFNLTLDGQLVAGSPFTYGSGSSTSVTINVIGNNASHTIVATDVSQSTCSATTNITTPSCACSMSVSAAVSGSCAGGNVPVMVTVTVQNPQGSGFNLTLDGQLVAGSPFPYSGGSSTSVTINVFGNNASHTIVATDVSQSTCSATTNITTPSCACSMSVSAAVSGSCAGGNVPVLVTVTVQNPQGSGFNLTLDGQLVAGSPFPYSGGSSTTVTINVLGNNASHTIVATDVSQSTCSATTNITTPSCACTMSVSAAVSGSCAGGNVPVTVTVSVQNPQGSGFNLTLDGQLVAGSPFPYSGGSNTSVTINVIGNNASHTIVATDVSQSTCSATTNITTPACGCSMSVSATVSGSCAGGNVPVPVTVTVQNPQGSGFNLTLDGQLVAGSPFSYGSGSSTTVTIQVPGNNAPHTIVTTDVSQSTCSATTNITTPNCACSMSVSAAVSGSCAGGNVPVNVVVTPTNPAGSGFNIFLDGVLVAGSPFTYSTGSTTTVTISVVGNGGQHTILVQDVSQSSCQATTTVTTPNCACAIGVTVSVTGGCNAQGQVPVTLVVTPSNPVGGGFNVILDGQLYPGSPFPWGGSSTTVTINVIGNNAAHTIVVQDSGNSACSGLASVTTPNCACSLAVTASVSGNCNSNLQVPVTVVVTPTNPAGFGFHLILDGVAVPGSPFPYTSGSGTTVTILVPGNGVSHSIVATDTGNSGCSGGATLTTPVCDPQQCSMSVSAAVSGNCNAQGQVPVTLTVAVSNPGGGHFNVFLDGSLVGNFPYSSSTTSVVIFVAGNGAAHSIQTQDVAIPSCSASTSLTTPNCGSQNCSLALTATVSGGCNPQGKVTVVLTVTPTNPVGTGFNVYVDGVLQAGGPFAYAASSTSVLVVGDGGQHTILVQDNQSPTCAATATVTTPNCMVNCAITSVSIGGVGNPRVHVVEVHDYTFEPYLTEIMLGDTVRFVWVTSIPHSTTSDKLSGVDHWDSGIIGVGSVYNVVVKNAGDHPYYCSNHGGPNGIGMTGIIRAFSPCQGGMANLQVFFTVQNGSQTGYKVFVDGILQPGSPFPYQTTNGLNSFILNIPGDGKLHALTLQDGATNFCAFTKTFTAPSCGEACGIDLEAVQTTPCNGDQKVGFDLKISHTNNGDSGFNVLLDGVLYPGNPFQYAGASQTTISILIIGDGKNHSITVVDADSTKCTASVMVQPPLCTGGPCEISDVSFVINPPATHTVMVDDDFFSPASLAVAVGDTVRFVWVGGHPHTVTSDALGGDDVFNSGLHSAGHVFDVVLKNSGIHRYYCIPHGSPGGIGMAGVLIAEDACADGKLPVRIQFSAQNGSTAGYTVMLDNEAIPGAPFDYDPSGTNTLTFPVEGDNATHTVMIMDAENANCMSAFDLKMPDCDDPCFGFRADMDLIINGFDLSVEFSATAASATSYSWTFGDGKTGSGQSITHQYASEGTYTACVTATNAEGCTDKVCQTFELAEVRCEAIFKWENTGLHVEFENISNSSVPIDSYLWDFGDNSGSTLQTPTHTYLKTGIYKVCLTITADSCTSTYCQTLDLSDPCLSLTPDFSHQTVGGNPLNISFSDLSTGNPTQWLWGFGDGKTSNLQNPTHLYAAPGAYNVCLIVASSELGCFSAPRCKKVFVDVVGTDSPGAVRALKLYPNPVSAGQPSLTLEGIAQEDFGKRMPLILSNLQGQRVFAGSIEGAEKMEFQLPENLPSGMFWIEIRGGSKMYRGKISVF